MNEKRLLLFVHNFCNINVLNQYACLVTCINFHEYFIAGGRQGCRCMQGGVLGVWVASPLPVVLPSATSVGQQHTSNAPRNCHPPVDSLCSLLNTFQRVELHTPQRRGLVHLTLTIYCRGGSRCQGKEAGTHLHHATTHDGTTSNNQIKIHLLLKS